MDFNQAGSFNGRFRVSVYAALLVAGSLAGCSGARITTDPVLVEKPAGNRERTIAARRTEESDADADAENPDERDLERFRFRANPDGTIPPNYLLKAKSHADRMPRLRVGNQAPRSGGVWNWTWLGPGNIGGRIRSILIRPDDPDRMWAGGVSGGIWRTDNAGVSWYPLDDFLPSLAVASLAMDAASPNTIYAGTGEPTGSASAIPAAGILKSTDGGDTWTQLGTTASWTSVGRIAAHPSTAGLLLAAVRGPNGVFRSTNGGVTWTQTLTTAGTCWDVKIDPGFPSHVLAGTSNEVWTSYDTGATWVEETTGAANQLPSDGGRCEVAFGPGSIWYVSMDRNNGEIWRSTNLGATWSLRNTGTNYFLTGSGNSQGGYDNALWVAPNDANVVVVGGIDLWRSTNGGTTLTKISSWQDYHDGSSAHADQHAIVSHPDYSANLHTVFVGNDGGIQRADNILQTASVLDHSWINLANNLGVTQFYKGAASPNGTVILGGAQDNSVLRLLAGDGTDQWYQGFTGDGGFCAVVGSSTMYSETQNMCIQKSTDGGNSWSRAITGLGDADTDGDGSCGPNNSMFVAPFVLDPSDNQTLAAGGSSIWYTDNGAASWVSIRSPLASGSFCTALAIAPTNWSRIWAGYADGTVSYTPVNILNWIDVAGFSGPITDIAVNPLDESEVYVTVGTLFGRLWYTSDQGNTWEQRSGSGSTALPAVLLESVTIHPDKPDWIYVGTDIGMFVSEDKGLTWNTTPRFGAGTDGPVYTEVSDLFWYDDDGQSVLVAATHGRGMYSTHPLVVVYVDHANTGDPDESGSASHPYDLVTEGYDAAGHGSTIAISAGEYNETTPLTLSKRVTLTKSGGTGSVVVR